MLIFNNKIVQFGFGAVGKSFYEKVGKEIKYNENNYHVITMDKSEFDAFVNIHALKPRKRRPESVILCLVFHIGNVKTVSVKMY